MKFGEYLLEFMQNIFAHKIMQYQRLFTTKILDCDLQDEACNRLVVEIKKIITVVKYKGIDEK